MKHSREIHSNSGKAKEYLAGWKRSRAELVNFQARVSSDQIDRDKRNQRQVIEDLMPVVDNFQAIIAHMPTELSDSSWAEGVLHVAKQLEQVLAQYNVKKIKAEGAKFDPMQHEAIDMVKNKKITSGYIIEVLQPGYTMGDEVIRPAKVKVAK
jgi:molecular chaperone GrpE